MTKRVRPSKEQYYMLIAQVVATRSNCVRRQIGAIVVVDDRIVATGYNGTPRGHKNCDEGGCPRCNSQGEQQSGQNLGECLCIHAEENCIASAAFHGGTKMRGGVIYTLMSPCLICSKLILNAGITAVMYRDVYPVNGLRLLIEAGVDVHQLDMERKHMRQIRTNEGEAKFIQPRGLSSEPRTAGNGEQIELSELQEWHHAVSTAEKAYMHLLDKGVSPQIARSVLPNALASKIIVTFNLRTWRHFFLMRTSKETHPQMKQVTLPLLAEFQTKIPILFEDIVPEQRQAEAMKQLR